MQSNANRIAPLADVVRDHVLSACEANGWNLTLTAGALGVAVKTVYNHVTRYERAGFVEFTAGGKRQRVTQEQGGGDGGDTDGDGGTGDDDRGAGRGDGAADGAAG